jgi:hypothetical protein
MLVYWRAAFSGELSIVTGNGAFSSIGDREIGLQSSTMLKPISRRGLLAGTLAGALTAQTRFPRKIRVGLSGFDGHAEEILRVLPDSPDIELAAVADDGSDPAARAQTLKDPFAAKAAHYDALEGMLARETCLRRAR